MYIIMEELRRALALLNSQEFEFMVFVKEKDRLSSWSTGNNFFSQGFMSSSIQKNPPLAFDALINRRKITVYEANIQPMIVLPLHQPILIQNYLYTAFKLLRQVPCKAVAKLWIKIIEPRKKTKFPYIKGDARKPAWWPKCVEHKEPDHLQKADRLNLMCAIIMEVLPQLPSSLEILDDVVRVTVVMAIFKRENVKRAIIKNVFEIAKCLCDKDFRHGTIRLADLNDLDQKQRKSYHRQPLSANKMANAEEELPQQSIQSNSSPLEVSPIKDDMEYISRESSSYPVSESYQNSLSQTKNVVDFDPLFLTKLDDISSGDLSYGGSDSRCFV